MKTPRTDEAARTLAVGNPMSATVPTDFARTLERDLQQARQERDAEMLRVKACEHIAEGEEGWEKLSNECPSTAAVAALRQQLAAAEKDLKEKCDLANAMFREVEAQATRLAAANARADAAEQQLTFHQRRVEAQHNAGQIGMPQGECECAICRPFYDKLHAAEAQVAELMPYSECYICGGTPLTGHKAICSRAAELFGAAIGNDTASLQMENAKLKALITESAPWRGELAAAQADRDKAIADRDEAIEKRDHSVQWYASRFEPLKDWARKVLDEKLRDEFFSIIANASIITEPPPTLTVQLNMMRHERDAALADREMWSNHVDDMEREFNDAGKKLIDERDALRAQSARLRDLLEFSHARFAHILEVWDDPNGERQTQHLRRKDAWGLEETISVIRDWMPALAAALTPQEHPAACAECERLREALSEYGSHIGVCDAKYNSDKPCTCGLRAALTAQTPSYESAEAQAADRILDKAERAQLKRSIALIAADQGPTP